MLVEREKHYVFGYGSLINRESRALTGYSGEAIPVRVNGVQRSWNRVAFVSRATFVGATFQQGISCNGVLISIPSGELPKFDQREASYARIPLNPENITPLAGQKLPEGKIWIYRINDPGTPSQEFPIVQSYIDVVMSGCLQISENFAREFITTTDGWSRFWINDRQHPRYRRAMKVIPLAKQIDEFLKDGHATGPIINNEKYSSYG